MDNGDYEFQILTEEKMRQEIAALLPLTDEDDAGDVLVEIDQILIDYSAIRDAKLDRWQTRGSRDQASKELEELASCLESSLSRLERLSPLARAALAPDLFDESSVLAILMRSMEILRPSVWNAYEKRFRSLVGDVETSRELLIRLRFPNRYPDAGRTGGPMEPMITAEQLSAGLHQHAAMAQAMASHLSELPLKRGRHPSLSDLFVTERLRDVWERYTKRRAAVSKGGEEDGRFLNFARACAKIVDPTYRGRGALDDLKPHVEPGQ